MNDYINAAFATLLLEAEKSWEEAKASGCWEISAESRTHYIYTWFSERLAEKIS